MLFKRKVTTVEAEQFLPKEGDTTFTLFGQECKVFRKGNGIKHCYFTMPFLDEELFIEQGQYLLMQEDGVLKAVSESYMDLYFEPVKE